MAAARDYRIDLVAVIGCAALIFMVAGLAAWVPARLTGGINPAEARRES